ncbi:MAG: DUF3048 domain-containing protein [Roseiflexaceae bacterium]
MRTFGLPRLAPLLTALALLGACSGQAAVPTPVAAPPTSAPAAVATAAPAPSSTPAPTAAPTAVPTPTVVPNPTADPITGAPAFARGSVKNRPILVMIDNHPQAYPQTGMDKAAVVFEALAEFGVTRFMALYAPGITPEADQIGPVRSTRLYFVHWAMGFHALYAHAGGSPQGLALAESTDEIVNLDALHADGEDYFVRSRSRAAPHNLYTSTDELLRAAEDRKAIPLEDEQQGFLFKTDAPAAERSTISPRSYFFIYPQDPAGWVYDPDTNGYLRLRRGVAARDAASGEQLWTKNVLVMEVAERPIPGDDKGRIEQDVIGEGPAKLFLDGVERDVTWRKPEPTAPLRFYDADGEEARFNAGPIWVVALPSLENLTVKQ